MDQRLPTSAKTFDNSDDSYVIMVLQSLPPLPSGGAEIQALRLAEALLRKGVNPVLITPGIGRLKGRSQINGVTVYRLHSPLNYLLDFLFFVQKKTAPPKTIIEYDDTTQKTTSITRKIGFGSRLRYIIFLINAAFFLKKRKNNFSIIHSHTIEWPGYVSAVLSSMLNKKLIVKDSTMNGITNILRFPSGRKKRELIIRQAHFIAMTRVIHDNLITAGVSPQKISLIPNGIDISGPYKDNFESADSVLFVGNLYQQPAKGVDILLKAWTIVSQKKPNAKLLIAGDGDINAYRNYCRSLKIDHCVSFLGKRSDIAGLMIESDVFVLPSRREGMPNVLMEAMLRAVPCVATDISGSQDLIDHMNTGILVPAVNVQLLAEGIDYLLTERTKAKIMAMNAREKIIRLYSMERVADEYIKLYKK